MTIQLDLFGTAAPSPARRQARPDTALLLAMSADHTTAPAATVTPAPRVTAAPRTGAELIAQSRSCCGRCEAVGHPSDYTWHDDSQELLCHPCNAAKLGYLATPNAHGVYLEPTERLALPRNVKGWQGCDTADIELLDLGPHWIWSTSYQLFGGDNRGGCSPLTDHPPERAATRAAALEAAKAELLRRIGDCDGTDARRVREWLDQLGQGALI